MPSDERKDRNQHQGDVPSDREALVGETAASEPLTARPVVQPPERATRSGKNDGSTGRPSNDDDADAAEQLGHS